MRIVNGSMLRVLTNLNLRKAPATTAPRLATIQADVLVTALAAPANGCGAWFAAGHTPTTLIPSSPSRAHNRVSRRAAAAGLAGNT